MRTHTRLVCVAAVPLVGLVSVAALLLFNLRATMLEEKKARVRAVVDSVFGILEHHEAQVARRESSAEEARHAALGTIKRLRYGDGDYFWINDMKPAMVMHPIKAELDGRDLTDHQDPDGKRLFVEFVATVRKDGAGFVSYKWSKPGATVPVPKMSYVRGFAPWGWVVGSGIYIDDVDAQFQAELRAAAPIVLPLILALALLGVWVTRSVTQPLAAVSRAVARAAEGDLTARVALARRDEFGETAAHIDGMLGRLDETMRHVQLAATQAARAAQNLAGASEEASGSSCQQAAALEKTAASLQHVSGAVARNAETARRVDVLAKRAASSAEEGGAVVQSAVTAMAAITASSRSIAEIVDTIDGIAFQTNVLALNAAVEAARAGDKGRGFAVIAAEVGTLAQRCAAASREVRELVSGALRSVDDGAALVESSGERLTRIVRDVGAVAGLIGEIASASTEQASGVTQVSRSVKDMDATTQRGATQAEQLSRTASELARQSGGLERLVTGFQISAANEGPGARRASPTQAA